MAERQRREKQRREQHAQEGVLDAQLVFPMPGANNPPAVDTIIKRDGRRAPFDKSKIADAINRAAESVGGEDCDRAGSIASGVALYLARIMDGQPPTVEQVHDAVEKVLIEMGHATIAIAYARYRDKRDRIRRLREGDMGCIADELAEARRERSEKGEGDEAIVWVRTAAESLEPWNLKSFVLTLLKEADVPPCDADVIAAELDHAARAWEVSSVAASRLRELAGAKLLERGLLDEYGRFQRLGLTVAEAERIMIGPNHGEHRFMLDPLATDVALGGKVKKEYALNHVFSPRIAEAHLRGDIHIHDLAHIDRLREFAPSLDRLKRTGFVPDSPRFVRPPRDIGALLTQMALFSGQLESHFTGRAVWDAFNIALAPFLQGLSQGALRQVAQSLLYEWERRAEARRDKALRAEFGLCWHIPAYLDSQDVVGPAGAVLGESYSEFAHASQQFAWALVDIYRQGFAAEDDNIAPYLSIRITDHFLKSSGHQSFLHHAADAAVQSPNVRFEFDRGGDILEGRTALQLVSLNLARLAYRVRDEDELFDELEALLDVAVTAHLQKEAFVERLLDLGEAGALAFLTTRHEGTPLLDPAEAAYLITAEALNECVTVMTGKGLHESGDALELGVRIMARLRDLCDRKSEYEQMHFVLCQAEPGRANRRFAMLDLRHWPDKARAMLKTDNLTQDICYTPGARAGLDAPLSPIERVRLEGRLHEWIDAHALTPVPVPDADTSRGSVADFIIKAYYQTRSHRIAFGRE